MEWTYGVSECWVLSRSCRLNWEAIAAVATLAATLVALWFGVRDAIRRRRDSKERGEVALALINPELVRIRKGLLSLLGALNELASGERKPDAETISQLATYAEFLQSGLEREGVDLFIDMPAHLRMNLPSVIRALNFVRVAPKVIAKGAANGPDDLAKRIDELQQLVRGCLIDFVAAVDYCEKHISPRQHENMKGITAPEP